jgi:hypothetical protein
MAYRSEEYFDTVPLRHHVVKYSLFKSIIHDKYPDFARKIISGSALDHNFVIYTFINVVDKDYTDYHHQPRKKEGSNFNRIPKTY